MIMALISLSSYSQNYERITAEEIAAKAETEAARIAKSKVLGRYTAIQDSLVIGAYTFYCYSYNKVLGGGLYELESGYTQTEKRALYDVLISRVTKTKFRLKGLVLIAKRPGEIEVYQADKYEKWIKQREELTKQKIEEMNRRLESLNDI